LNKPIIRIKMARHAEKKRAKTETETMSLYWKIFIGLTVWYVASRIIWQWSTFSFWTLIAFSFLSLINYICLQTIHLCLQQGSPYDYYEDIQFINWFVQATTPLSSWFWFTYIMIPGYLAYQFGGRLLGLLFSSQSNSKQDQPQLSEKELKRLEKKERKKNRIKYKKM